MSKYTKLTPKQHMVMMDFLATAKTNSLNNLAACVPSSHPMFKTNQVRQIRVVTDAIAWGWDELGNRVRLTSDLRVLQETGWGDSAR
jgi:hypothetical protein